LFDINKGIRIDASDFAVLAPGVPVITGTASPFLRELCRICRLELITMADDDRIAIPNAIPTAEGAIALAITESPWVLQEETAIVIGYGRIGRELAKRLSAMGAKVFVANRGETRMHLAEEDGFCVMEWALWKDMLPYSKYIFNTVPAPILGKDELANINADALIIDLAATPGGTDFIYANELGIKAILASGLPGRFSADYAGKILSEVYPVLLKEKLL